MVLNRYKGSGKKGRYISRIVPKTLLKLATKCGHMEYIFRTSYRSASGWSKLVSDTFHTYSGRRVGINILRKSYVSHLFRTTPHMNEAEKKHVALQMGTSVGKLMLVYRKID
jgi:hypothetical protein